MKYDGTYWSNGEKQTYIWCKSILLVYIRQNLVHVILMKTLNYHDHKTNLLTKPKVVDKQRPVATDWVMKAP